MERKKILFVCQRYGLEVNGGAETECRMYAERLTPYYRVEVLTTCALDYLSWENYYAPGDSEINGVTVHRFATDCCRSADFERLTDQIKLHHSPEEEQRWINAQGPVSSGLINFLRDYGDMYAVVIFMTYLYYTTAQGMQVDCGRKILIPTAHDEWTIYLSVFDRVFALADKLIYNSQAEKRFVLSRFPALADRPSVVVGSGVEVPERELPDVRERFGISDPFVCYSGRIDPSKGCDTMFRYFLAYKKRHPGKLRLVLTGRSSMEIPESEDILSLGFVSEEEKYAVMGSAQLLIQPSFQESLSIVSLESLLMGRPILVNGYCEVLKEHCILGGAGLYYTNYYEFEAALDYLLSRPDTAARMGRSGKQYVEEHYRWEKIVEEIRRLIEE